MKRWFVIVVNLDRNTPPRLVGRTLTRRGAESMAGLWCMVTPASSPWHPVVVHQSNLDQYR